MCFTGQGDECTNIEDVVASCQTCSMYQRSNMKEPLICHEIPTCPWAEVGADLFELNKKMFLLLVDYYSGLIEPNQLSSTTGKGIITYCKSQFARHSIPDILISNNGPQFSSDMFKNHINLNIEHPVRTFLSQMEWLKRQYK